MNSDAVTATGRADARTVTSSLEARGRRFRAPIVDADRAGEEGQTLCLLLGIPHRRVLNDSRKGHFDGCIACELCWLFFSRVKRLLTEEVFIQNSNSLRTGD